MGHPSAVQAHLEFSGQKFPMHSAHMITTFATCAGTQICSVICNVKERRWLAYRRNNIGTKHEGRPKATTTVARIEAIQGL
ncbi:hypothetical protein K491DRAFT_451513 [Lophiostoma macrostomum CBS 122681]|uniref:Uncharacterized protein n=1 Tax=Lophiostoma macrostomum CBS 122681 TaxID=1314788 RepID=A0A6A6TR35_9PLEO|nr:hypothetical protein K491DRAFT_451513 [Lophiostoma macrostomum CBS 122681]